MFLYVSYTPRMCVSHSLGVDALDDRLDISDLGYLRTNDSYGVSYNFMVMKSKGLPDWLRSQRLGVFLRANQNGDGYLNRGYAGVFGGFIFSDNSEFRMEMNYLPPYYDDKKAGVMESTSMRGDIWFYSHTGRAVPRSLPPRFSLAHEPVWIQISVT